MSMGETLGIRKMKLHLWWILLQKGVFDSWDDEKYLKFTYQMRTGLKLNLKNPRLFNEKLQWLKLYDRNPEYTRMVDKYEVKIYMADKIGKQYIIPTLGVWDRFDDIDFDALPEQFVLKCTHDSGGLVICKDKSKLDRQFAREKIEKSLMTNYYLSGREWPYKSVKHRIIAEPYMEDSQEKELRDYKFFCFDGYVDNVMLAMDRSSGDTKFYFFNKNWELMRLNIRGKNAPKDFTLPKPNGIDEMFEMASELSKGIPFVRVDLYYCNGHIYFGEMTFFPQSGFDANLLPETDDYLGKLIDLDKAYSRRIVSC